MNKKKKKKNMNSFKKMMVPASRVSILAVGFRTCLLRQVEGRRCSSRHLREEGGMLRRAHCLT